ncbi:MAG: GNAT family N-acetyltransferase [Gammaproteobacteria bacterium]|jgi:ribosomal protein S18 acetylase RimI-like enzyme
MLNKDHMSTTVRQAVLSDIEALAPLFDSYRQFYGLNSDLQAAREFLVERFNHGESTLFIAHEGESAVGFSQLYPSFSSASLSRTLILNDLFVSEDHRGKGVGKMLITAVIDFAKAIGATRVTLATGTDNTAAQALYRSCDWKRDEQFVVYHYHI